MLISDLEGENPHDDNAFLGNLATFAYEHGLDHEELFRQLGIKLEGAVENDDETE